ncbi:hypothetical protein JRO89_XS01G0362400 [Xanthoceras sorbifolium]|uniref:Small ribosomal subunit protein uS14m n=1 Tax=Xanthoceras sorbifolium TaxID=99658 RepID=A0ABQ8INH5_9ROSI|nr:hypothetical protein JRO89_XS01G0362400 [Xanthoceras sorbifolium]
MVGWLLVVREEETSGLSDTQLLCRESALSEENACAYVHLTSTRPVLSPSVVLSFSSPSTALLLRSRHAGAVISSPRLLAAKYEVKRKLYKALHRDIELPNELREKYLCKLSQLPRNSSFTRVRNRCIFTGRPRAVYEKFRMSRIVFRSLASQGMLMGIKKASWIWLQQLQDVYEHISTPDGVSLTIYGCDILLDFRLLESQWLHDVALIAGFVNCPPSSAAFCIETGQPYSAHNFVSSGELLVDFCDTMVFLNFWHYFVLALSSPSQILFHSAQIQLTCSDYCVLPDENKDEFGFWVSSCEIFSPPVLDICFLSQAQRDCQR